MGFVDERRRQTDRCDANRRGVEAGGEERKEVEGGRGYIGGTAPML